MSFELAQKVADAVLYEGYVLYPYRASSSKNQVRFQWGVIAPCEYSEAGGSEPWEMQTECLVEPGAAPTIDLKIRGLQLQARIPEEATADGGFRPVEFLNVEGELLLAWDEGVERELEVNGIDLLSLERDGEREIPFEFPGGTEVEELGTESRMVRRRWPVSILVRLSAEKVEDWLRLRVRIENQTPVPDGLQRDEALRRSLVSAHTLLKAHDGSFLSLLDPPPEAAQAAAGCVNVRTWPVLIGSEKSGGVLLSSPIILYDDPAIAPESPGDLCDATEIDEILTLRIMTLTDEEKRQARGTDPRARRIIDRADSIPDEILERLHGAVRSLRPAGETSPSRPHPRPLSRGERGDLAEDLELVGDEILIFNGLEETYSIPDGNPARRSPPSPSGRGAGGEVSEGTWPDSVPTFQTPSSSITDWETFLNPPGETPPEEASLTIAETRVAKGSRVRLRPSRRADSMDFFLAGRDARVEGVYRDVEDESYVAVTLLDDDPEGDLHAATGRFLYFYPDEIEPLSLEER